MHTCMMFRDERDDENVEVPDPLLDDAELDDEDEEKEDASGEEKETWE